MEVKNDFNIRWMGAEICQGRLAGSAEMVVAKEAFDELITEGGEDFYNYVAFLGLLKEPDLIVLSSKHHYYYDSEEMNKAKTVVNLKELNRIREIKSFFHSHLYSLTVKCSFVGFFINNAKVDRYSLRDSSSLHVNKKRTDDIENSIVSRFPFINMLYGLMDSKKNAYMTEAIVRLLLKDNGFKVIDMTELNGLTFFHSQKL